MKSVLLVDGNSVLFRAYYATMRNMMRTKNRIPTNAVYGFINIVNSVLSQLNPDGVLVAWDSGKPTFRHEMYKEYKGTRHALDDDLIVQFPIVRQYLDARGILRYEREGIEADDIIGSFAKQHPEYKIHILTSDKDLLQLIDDHIDVYLMKTGSSDMKHMDEVALMEAMSVTPLQIIELKALMGDSSDNIPGVKGVGEKTAVKLLKQYGNIECLYEHIDEIKGKLKEKLIQDKEMAQLSKVLATISIKEELPLKIEDLKIKENNDTLYDFYTNYEMFSLMSNVKKEVVETQMEKSVETIVPRWFLEDGLFIYVDHDNENFYDMTIYGFALCKKETCIYIYIEDALKDESFLEFLKHGKYVVYDAKNVYHMMKRAGIEVSDASFDVMIAAFLIDQNINSLENLWNTYHLRNDIKIYDVYGKRGRPILVDENLQVEYACLVAYQCASLVDELKNKLDEYELNQLYDEIELPLTKVLYALEEAGIHCDKNVLDEIAKSMQEKIDELSKIIYKYANMEFNINSPKQLASILYDELGLPSGKKRSTAADVLEKLSGVHPIIPVLLEYRKYQKILSTYAQGLANHILKDGKIHTLFNQIQTQTGRLSSSEPNLQNISVRDEEGKEIRKAFVASEGHVLLSADYSQIELRMLAHMAKEEKMMDAFNHNEDIHTKTAMQIFDVDQEDIDSNMRRSAKTVNFGIIYGQSDFGLAQQLNISNKEAHAFIEKYFASYPKIESFMNDTIQTCETKGYVTTIFNRRRYIPEISDKNFMIRSFGKRAAMNAPIQGSAADLIKLAMVKIYQTMQEKNMQSKMILQIHDELIFDVIDDEIDEMKIIIQEGMQNVLKLSVPLVAEVKMGKSWYEAK